LKLGAQERGAVVLLRRVAAIRPLTALQECGDACCVCGSETDDLTDTVAGSWLRVCTDAEGCVSRRLAQKGGVA